MKNQYVADVNDYRKYGLLRLLSGHGALRTGVCWMLTPDDDRADGQLIGYLDAPERYRAFVPPLFDALAACVGAGERHVRTIEASGVLSNTVFYSEVLMDEAAERERYFAAMWERLAGVDLLFFDPDNGLEVPSRPYGRRHSSKYLYWREVEAAYRSGASVLVYQHFIREARGPFTERLARDMAERLGTAAVLAFWTPHVLFLLAAQVEHAQHFERQAEVLEASWPKGQLHLAGRW